jgi:NAD(P)H-dependent FMN reductase
VIRVAIVAGSTRPGRRAARVASWVHDRASAGRPDARFEIVDLAGHELPHLDEPVPAAFARDYAHAHTRAWAETIAAHDAFVFVTPEYNHSAPAVLKNAIDFLYDEWADKAAGFVSYGTQGGVRAVEHLRLVMAELRVADVRSQVALSLFDDFEEMSELRPRPRHEPTLRRMLDEIVAWADALQRLRQEAAVAADA